jgi:aminopeptidase N
MKTDKHLRKHLKDYQPPEFGISKTHLEFHLDASCTRVLSRLQMHRMSSNGSAELVLDGI